VTTIQYLYGFVPSDAPDPPAELRGIDGRPVGRIDVGGFSAATSSLDASEYAAGRLEGRISDLGWVGPRGIEHERVVTWFADHATIVPARLLTLFSSEDALLDEARRRGDVLTGRLERFRDRREWDLKASYDLDAAAVLERSPHAAELAAQIADAAPGRRYLLERRLEEVVREEGPAAARAIAGDLLAELAMHADEVTELAIPSRQEALPVVLDAARAWCRRGRTSSITESSTD
jgi:hypothetical protein